MYCAEEQQLKTMEEQVDNIWKPRLTAADPFEGSLQKERVSMPAQHDTSSDALLPHVRHLVNTVAFSVTFIGV